MKRSKLNSLDQSGASNGDTVKWNSSTKKWVATPVVTTGVQTVTAGTYIVVDSTDPLHIIVTAMVPMTTLNSSGLPEIVFDSDGHIVYAEAP